MRPSPTLSLPTKGGGDVKKKPLPFDGEGFGWGKPNALPRADCLTRGQCARSLGRFAHRLAIDGKRAIAERDRHLLPVLNAAFEQHGRERVLQRTLDHPLQWPRAID